MFRSYRPRSHRTPYGLHRFHRVKPSAIRYARSPLSYGQMRYRPRFYPPPPPAKNDGFSGGILGALAALFCRNRSQPNRQVIPRRGFGGGGGLSTSGGGGGD